MEKLNTILVLATLAIVIMAIGFVGSKSMSSNQVTGASPANVDMLFNALSSITLSVSEVAGTVDPDVGATTFDVNTATLPNCAGCTFTLTSVKGYFQIYNSGTEPIASIFIPVGGVDKTSYTNPYMDFFIEHDQGVNVQPAGPNPFEGYTTPDIPDVMPAITFGINQNLDINAIDPGLEYEIGSAFMPDPDMNEIAANIHIVADKTHTGAQSVIVDYQFI